MEGIEEEFSNHRLVEVSCLQDRLWPSPRIIEILLAPTVFCFLVVNTIMNI